MDYKVEVLFPAWGLYRKFVDGNARVYIEIKVDFMPFQV